MGSSPTHRPRAAFLRRATAFLLTLGGFWPLFAQEPPSSARLAELRAQIAHHDALYFQAAAPEISDSDYDALKRELAALERSLAATASPSTTGAVTPAPTIPDDRTAGFGRHAHGVPMLSLEKAYSETELRAFLERFSGPPALTGADQSPPLFVVEPKYDGVALSVIYEHGQLARAVTRGNGLEGDDVTANARAIASLPRQLQPLDADGSPLPPPAFVELRGEVYLTFAEFERLNRAQISDGESPFANPRNLAAGSLKLLDPALVARRHLSVVFYGLGEVVPATARPASQQALHAQLQAWGVPCIQNPTPAHDADEVWSAVRELGARRDRLAFPIDGAVIKANALASQQALGASATAPRWAIAYKFPPRRAETVLRGITLQVGRSGALTPVAELAPVELAGSTLTRASLHNRQEIARRDLRIGDTVILEKAGEIIPAIVGVNLARRPPTSVPYVFPDACPACATAAVTREGGAILFCPNAACPARCQRQLEHFASRGAVDIDGLGAARIESLVATGRVKTAADLYRLRREDLLTLSGDGEVSAERLLTAIAASKAAELWRVIHGLGIPRVGVRTARQIARQCSSLERLAAAPTEIFADLGTATAQSLRVYLDDPAHRALLRELHALGLGRDAASDPFPPALAGQSIVLTGKLPTLTREQATALIEAAGGKVTSSVTPQTDLVVAGENPGAKLEQARRLNRRVIDEAGLFALLAADEDNDED